MKRWTWLLLLAVDTLAWGQNLPQTFTINAVTTSPACANVRVQNNSAVGIIVAGTFSGTITPSVYINPARPVNKKVAPVDSSTAQSTITAAGGYTATVGGFAVLQFCATAWSSGTATVDVFSTPAPNTTVASGSGSGVTSVSGTSPVASSGGTTPAISLQNSGASNITNAYGTDTGFLSCAGVIVNGDVVTGDANQGCNDSGTLLTALAPKASPTFSGTVTNPDGTTITSTGPVWGTGYTAPMTTSFWATGSTAVSFNSSSNKAQLWGFTIAYPITSSKLTVGVVAADTGSCTYDLGVLNSSGNIVWHTGNQTASALGFTSMGTKTISWAASATAQPGKYYAALTASATTGCATIGASVMPTFLSNTAETVSSGGTLNNGITIPSDVQTFANVPSFYIQ